MQKVNCKAYADAILRSVQRQRVKGKLAIITVGSNPASEAYVRGKMKDAEFCGIPVDHRTLEDNVTYCQRPMVRREVVNLIDTFSRNDSYAGIILQLPIPAWMGEVNHITYGMSRHKDVDGFLPGSDFEPCTPEGVMHIIHGEIGSVDGLNALVIGRSDIVGKPLARMLLSENATVTVAHSHTQGLDEILPNYDIVVSAAGRPNLVDLSKCKAQLVVDVGINRVNGHLCGDCFNYEETGDGMKVTPVPKGIGLMTRAMLMKHVAEASRRMA